MLFDTAGMAMQYRREGAVNVAIIEATLAALTTAWADGGFLEIGNGYYRLDLPDAALASGARGVLVHGIVTGMVVIGEYVELVAYDPEDAVALGLTRLDAAISSRLAPTTAARTLDILATGEAAADVTLWRGSAPNVLQSGRVDAFAGVIATDAIDNLAFATSAVTEIWGVTVAELGVGIPATTPSALNAIALIYMALRNEITVDASFMTFANNAGTVIWKKAVSEAASVYTEAKGVSG